MPPWVLPAGISSGTPARATSLGPPSTPSDGRGDLGAASIGQASSSARMLVMEGAAAVRYGGDAIFGADEAGSGGDEADELEAQVEE